MATVTHQVLDPRGEPINGHPVAVRLYAPGNPFTDTGASVTDVKTVTTDADGRFTVDLLPTLSYEHAGARYEIDARAGQRKQRVDMLFYITVPDTAGPHELRDLLATAPNAGAPVPPVVAHTLNEHADVDTSSAAVGNVLVFTADGWRPGAGGGGGGITDHGGLSGLADDDHPQYHNDTRGDVRYYPRASVDALLAAHVGASDPHAQYLTEVAAAAAYSPLGHEHSYADITGTVPTSALPALAITDTFPVASEAAMLALGAQRGDVAVRSDILRTFILAAEPATVLANWTELATPADTVLSVNGQAGVVVLGKADVGLGNVTNTADADKPVSTAQAAAIVTAVTDHEGAVNPHPQYALTAGLAAVATSGDYADLDGLPFVSTNQVLVLGPADPVPGETPVGTVILRTA